MSGSNQAKVLTTPTRAGYIFNGYSISTNTSGSSSSITNNTTLNIPANAYGNITVSANWTIKKYWVDVNILSPSGVQDNASGTVDIVYSAPSQSLNDVTNEPSSSLVEHGGTITISDIKPAAGYMVTSVYLSNNRGTLVNNGNGSYTFTATTDWTHQTQWYDTIVIQMAWKQYVVDINILNPSAEQDNKSGTMDVVYSTPSQSINDVTNEASSSLIQHGGTITISDIKPAAGY